MLYRPLKESKKSAIPMLAQTSADAIPMTMRLILSYYINSHAHIVFLIINPFADNSI